MRHRQPRLSRPRRIAGAKNSGIRHSRRPTGSARVLPLRGQRVHLPTECSRSSSARPRSWIDAGHTTQTAAAHGVDQLDVGLVGLAWWGHFQAGGAITTKSDVERFAALRNVVIEAPAPDQSLWSPESVTAWRKALLAPPSPLSPSSGSRRFDSRLPVCRAPTTDAGPRRRAHRGNGPPASSGNIGHRRTPRRLLPGLEGHRRGRPDRSSTRCARQRRLPASSEPGWSTRRTSRCSTRRDQRALTLVTCYPFYFVGSAPRRFIVRAVPVSRVASQLIA